MHPNVHCSTVYNAKMQKQPKCLLAKEWKNKMWYIYTMDYYSIIKKNKIMSVAATWIDLEISYSVKQVRERKTNTLLVQFTHSVMSNSLQLHEPQHTRPPCPSPNPRVHPNPCPLCQ